MNELKLHRQMSQTNEYYDSPGYPVEETALEFKAPQLNQGCTQGSEALWTSSNNAELDRPETKDRLVEVQTGQATGTRNETIGTGLNSKKTALFEVQTGQAKAENNEIIGTGLNSKVDPPPLPPSSEVEKESSAAFPSLVVERKEENCSQIPADASADAADKDAPGSNSAGKQTGADLRSLSADISGNTQDSDTLAPAEPPFLRAMRGGNIDAYLNPVDFCAFLAWLGYRRYLGNGTCEIVKPQGWILERVDMLKAKQDVEELIKANDFIQGVKDRVFRKTKEFFKIKNLTSLPEFEGEFLVDSEGVCVKLYLNCLIKVTKDGFERLPYEKLDRFIWKEDIIQRAFAYDPDWREGIYYQFTKNQCSDPRRKAENGQATYDEQRHLAYLCSLGYNLHSFRSRLQSCLTIYSDSTEGDRERNGGSGKSMIIQFLSAMQAPGAASGDRLVLETGENLRSDYAHNFDKVTRQTRVVVIDDLDTKRFRLEDVYSWVTVGLKVNKKGQESCFIPYEEVPKCVITSNNPVSGTRDSDTRRRMDVQLHRFYNASHKPIQDFGRGFFNEGFTARDWRQFDCLALKCIQLSLRHQVATQGLPAYANNVLETSLELEIGDDLVEFLGALVLPQLEAAAAYKLDAKSLKTDYEEAYKVRRRESAKSFNKRLRRYGELRRLEVEIRPGAGINWCCFKLNSSQ